MTVAPLRQEPLLLQELLETPLFPRTDAKGTCIYEESSILKGQLAAVRTGFGSSLWLWDRLQERCWSWGQLHGVSRAGGGALLSWGGTQHLVQGVVRPPGTQRGGGIHLLPLFLLPLHQLSENPWEPPLWRPTPSDHQPLGWKHPCSLLALSGRRAPAAPSPGAAAL